jgi:hypothetical protein
MKLSFIKAVKFAILRRSALTGGIEHLRTYQCQLDRLANELRRHKKVKSPLFELTRVLVPITFPRNLAPEFTHYLCEQTKED